MAAWFGGSLMGAIGLNGGAAKAKDPTERLFISSIGWGRWAPVQLVAIAVHGIGGIGLMIANRNRLAAQRQGQANVLFHVGLTAAAGATSVVAAIAGAKILEHAREGADGVTEPGPNSSAELATAQRVEKVTQWLIPALTGVLLVLGAQQGELQRPAGLAQGRRDRAKQIAGR
jgi:hypothetical protein